MSTFCAFVQEFFASWNHFHGQYNRFQEKVNALAGRGARIGALDASNTSDLLDFEALRVLKDEHLYPLKESAHALLRREGRTDRLDRYVSDIFHEVSILCEEHYRVKTYAPQYAEEKDEYDIIVEEAREFIPRRISHVSNLFEKALRWMEEILPDHRAEKILIRSLYLLGDELVAPAYGGSLARFYERMYPGFGVPLAYFEVAKSFYRSGFVEHSRTAAGRALASGENCAPELKENIEKFLGFLDRSASQEDSEGPLT